MPTKADASSAQIQRKAAVIDDIKERLAGADLGQGRHEVHERRMGRHATCPAGCTGPGAPGARPQVRNAPMASSVRRCSCTWKSQSRQPLVEKKSPCNTPSMRSARAMRAPITTRLRASA